MNPRGQRRTGLSQYLPEPARFWISHAPRKWLQAGGSWTDLGASKLRNLDGQHDTRTGFPSRDTSTLDGLFYLPPIALDGDEDSTRDDWLSELEGGTSVLVQLQPGETLSAPADVVVYDLLRPLLSGNLEELAFLPTSSLAVWPLIPGLTDSVDLWERGCKSLADAGAACVQPLTVELEASDRRVLAELGGEGVFDALFHGAQPSERKFSQYAVKHGLAAFTPRPASGRSPRELRNRRFASDLALAGELWLRLERSVSVGQGLLQAARQAENTTHDLRGLAFDGNLGVLSWLNAESVSLIAEAAVDEESSLLEVLLNEYLFG